MRTVLVHTGGIGDFLLTCPAIQRLAEGAPVELVGCRDRLSLAVAAGLARAAHDLDAVAFDSILGNPEPRARAFFAQFDRAIVFIRDDGLLERGLRACGVPEVRTFPGLPPDDWNRHASEYYLDCLGFGPAPPLRIEIAPSPLHHDALFHPGSGARRKNWPIERFIELAAALERRGRTVAWCLGPAEEGLALAPNAAILRVESLLSLARELAAARLYIGNDSGVAHLAAAVGCPTVAIFGPTDPRVWAPFGAHVRVVRGNPWPDVKHVLDAVYSRVS